MYAYFDLVNLRSFAKFGAHSDFQTCIDMLRQNFDIRFTFDRSLIQKEKKQAQMSIMTLVKKLSRNRGDSEGFKWNYNYPPRPLTEDIYDKMDLDLDNLMSIYFIDDENIKEMVSHGCLLFAEEGCEMKVLTNLLIDGKVATKTCNSRKMTDWSLIEDNASPCTDIVISDPYFFAKPDYLYEYNSYKIVECLARWNKSHALNIVIFTYPQYKDGDIRRDVPFITVERQLKNRVETITGVIPNVTFVKLPERTEHDRIIITNYKMFDSGDSFTYFDERGISLSHGRRFYIHTHGDKNLREQAKECLKDFQSIIDDLKKGLNSIMGDKKSNFLKF